MIASSPASRVFVKNLPATLSLEDFRNHFSQKAPITDAKLLAQRGIGYVGYKTSQDAEKAVTYFNKSFVGMARLSVEIAKPVGEVDPRAAKRRRLKRHIKEDVTTQETDTTNGRSTSGDSSRKDRSQAKKDASLNEYMEVMHRPSKAKTWQNQDDTYQANAAELLSKPEEDLPPDIMNDSDYESVPKRQKPPSKKAQVVHSEVPSSPKTRGPKEDDTIDEVVVEAEKEEIADDIPTAASDTDWLRSRTSRLLGLIDDDEAIEERLFEQDKSTATVAIQDKTISAPEDHSSKSKSSSEKEGGEDLRTKSTLLDTDKGDADKNNRLFVRNLTYTVTEDDLRHYFESLGYGTPEEVHLPIDSRSGRNKGFAHISFEDPNVAQQVLENADQKSFQGRLLHLIPSTEKKHVGLDDFAISKLPLKKQQQIKRKAEAASSTFNWNSMFMSADAVVSSIADRLKVSKSDVLGPTTSDAAVKQAHAETHVIQETKAYFASQGIDLKAFKRKERGDTAILVKNFPYGTREVDLKLLFEKHAPILRILMPPAATLAIVQFDDAEHARAAFKGLAYSRFKESLLFLEKAPKDLFRSDGPLSMEMGARAAKPSSTDLLQGGSLPESVDTSTLFVKNLNFSTTSQRLQEHFATLDGFRSARVKTRTDPKKPGQTFSMGFGFLEFHSKEQAQAAIAAMDGYKLDGHELLVRASHNGLDAAQQRRKEDQAKKASSRSTKIIIKNLPFESSKHDIRSLFGAYGKLRSVRVPKKFDSSTRGFAFADFTTAREAETAMEALQDTHLLGRRLVLEAATGDALDPEVEIEKMQQKVSKQSDKVALQRFAGSGRKRFALEGGDDVDRGS